MNPKQVAATRSVMYIENGMTVGLGSGSTAAFAVAALGERLRNAPLDIRCIATSKSTYKLAQGWGINLIDWDSAQRFDITIDGADEIDPQFRMIKGGGGALVSEKIVAANTDQEIIIVDERKVVDKLGAFPLPVAVVPFGWPALREKLQDKYRCAVNARRKADGALYFTDEGLIILDMAFAGAMPDADTLEPELNGMPGVAEVGLFRGLCHRLIVGFPDGHIEEKTP